MESVPAKYRHRFHRPIIIKPACIERYRYLFRRASEIGTVVTGIGIQMLQTFGGMLYLLWYHITLCCPTQERRMNRISSKRLGV